jgi:transcriptional regulator with XRE-family HTH domain
MLWTGGERQNMFIPNNLIKAREDMGLSRTDFMFALDKIGVRISPPTLRRWETGQAIPDVNELFLIAKLLGKTLGYFFAS